MCTGWSQRHSLPALPAEILGDADLARLPHACCDARQVSELQQAVFAAQLSTERAEEGRLALEKVLPSVFFIFIFIHFFNLFSARCLCCAY